VRIIEKEVFAKRLTIYGYPKTFGAIATYFRKLPLAISFLKRPHFFQNQQKGGILDFHLEPPQLPAVSCVGSSFFRDVEEPKQQRGIMQS